MKVLKSLTFQIFLKHILWSNIVKFKDSKQIEVFCTFTTLISIGVPYHHNQTISQACADLERGGGGLNPSWNIQTHLIQKVKFDN